MVKIDNKEEKRETFENMMSDSLMRLVLIGLVVVILAGLYYFFIYKKKVSLGSLVASATSSAMPPLTETPPGYTA
jgi:flagellar basal body-associated protein FliL